jgi:cold shock CspA family protein
MPSSEGDPSADTETSVGCVKWFNNKAGYGFINITKGEQTGSDVFVHHSAIQVGKEQYKYLVQGEYVQFNLCKADAGSHEWQAGNVRGLDNGKLMCETRYESRLNRVPGERDGVDANTGDVDNERVPGPRRAYNQSYTNSQEQGPPVRPRYRGMGPREGEEWLLVRRRVHNRGGQGPPERRYANRNQHRE